jgi:hypothetical protein
VSCHQAAGQALGFVQTHDPSIPRAVW